MVVVLQSVMDWKSWFDPCRSPTIAVGVKDVRVITVTRREEAAAAAAAGGLGAATASHDVRVTWKRTM
jgi:hypothetical protein